MNFDERVQAVSEYGFTERQARFLVTVMRTRACVSRVSTRRLPASPTGTRSASSSTASRGVDSRPLATTEGQPA
jgi:hypothetical protein